MLGKLADEANLDAGLLAKGSLTPAQPIDSEVLAASRAAQIEESAMEEKTLALAKATDESEKARIEEKAVEYVKLVKDPWLRKQGEDSTQFHARIIQVLLDEILEDMGAGGLLPVDDLKRCRCFAEIALLPGKVRLATTVAEIELLQSEWDGHKVGIGQVTSCLSKSVRFLKQH
eukprot:8669324-Alexandrium_andersonii.AAC.1